MQPMNAHEVFLQRLADVLGTIEALPDPVQLNVLGHMDEYVSDRKALLAGTSADQTEAERLRGDAPSSATANVTEDECQHQHPPLWHGMDGAIAWLMIERQSNNWEEARDMMHAWLRANGGTVPLVAPVGEAQTVP